MERFWNIVYYCTYKMNCKGNYYFYKFTGLSKIYDILFIKRRFKNKFGIDDPKKQLLDINNDPKSGLNIIFTDVLMGGWCMLFLFALLIFFIMIMGIEPPKNTTPLIVVIILCVIICEWFLQSFFWRKNKYQKFFKQFDKKPRKWKIKWAWISLGVILFPFVVLVLCFVVLSK